MEWGDWRHAGRNPVVTTDLREGTIVRGGNGGSTCRVIYGVAEGAVYYGWYIPSDHDPLIPPENARDLGGMCSTGHFKRWAAATLYTKTDGVLYQR